LVTVGAITALSLDNGSMRVPLFRHWSVPVLTSTDQWSVPRDYAT
jgi:hypothetical protein